MTGVDRWAKWANFVYSKELERNNITLHSMRLVYVDECMVLQGYGYRSEDNQRHKYFERVIGDAEPLEDVIESVFGRLDDEWKIDAHDCRKR